MSMCLQSNKAVSVKGFVKVINLIQSILSGSTCEDSLKACNIILIWVGSFSFFFLVGFLLKEVILHSGSRYKQLFRPLF